MALRPLFPHHRPSKASSQGNGEQGLGAGLGHGCAGGANTCEVGSSGTGHADREEREFVVVRDGGGSRGLE